MSLSGPVFCSCSILFLDFLDHVFVVTETLAILRVFCHTASQAVQVKVCRAIGSQTRTYTTFFPRLKVKKSGRVYLHNNNFSGYSGFPAPQKSTFPNSNSTRNQVHEESLIVVDVLPLIRNLLIYLIFKCRSVRGS